jgi:hypothetical protein
MRYRLGQAASRRKRYLMIGPINATNDQVFFFST